MALRVASVLVAHVAVPALEAERTRPASMSKAVVSDMLRGQIGYNGMVMTDCLEMGAIQKHYGTGEAVVQCLLAGVDMVLVCHTEKKQMEAIEAICKAVMEGRLPLERLVCFTPLSGSLPGDIGF